MSGERGNYWNLGGLRAMPRRSIPQRIHFVTSWSGQRCRVFRSTEAHPGVAVLEFLPSHLEKIENDWDGLPSSHSAAVHGNSGYLLLHGVLPMPPFLPPLLDLLSWSLFLAAWCCALIPRAGIWGVAVRFHSAVRLGKKGIEEKWRKYVVAEKTLIVKMD